MVETTKADLLFACWFSCLHYGNGQHFSSDEELEQIVAFRQAALLEGVRIGKEAALAEVDQQRKDFASPEYATPQPIGSLTERFACSECFNAIDILDPAEVLAAKMEQQP